MPSKVSKMENFQQSKEETLSSKLIFSYLIMAILLLESIITLILSLRKGLFKKETIKLRNNLGFDFEIIMKSR